MQKKKMGRPTDNPRTGVFQVRTTDEDEKMLAFCCKETGRSKADIIRYGLKKVYDELKE